ncbi:MAG: hypothetical protein ACRCWQ_10810 [Bacilli bacterium]
MSNILNELIQESTVSANIDLGRPQLLALTRAVNELIYTDLVAIQKTKTPIATLLGMRYKNRDGEMTFRTPATYGGLYGDRSKVTLELSSNLLSFAKDDVFKYQSVVYQAIEAVNLQDLGGGDDIDKQLALALMINKVRIMSDAGETGTMEYIEPSESMLTINRWKIEAKTRKLKSEVSHEFIQDLKANGLDADNVIRQMLAHEIADEINRDVMQKLQTVSIRHVSPTTASGIYFAGGSTDDPIKGRTLYRIVAEMARQLQSETSFDATYVLCSPRVAGLLTSSGWLKGDPTMRRLYAGTLTDGLKVYVDTVSRFDYLVVGTKQTMDELESIGSLFYTPYVEQDDVGFTIVNSPEDLQPRYMCMARYGLSVNPYTTSTENEQINAGDNWNELAGKSKYSRFVGVVFGS